MKTSSMLLALPVVDRLAASASGTDTDVDASVDVRPAGESAPVDDDTRSGIDVRRLFPAGRYRRATRGSAAVGTTNISCPTREAPGPTRPASAPAGAGTRACPNMSPSADSANSSGWTLKARRPVLVTVTVTPACTAPGF